MADQRVVSLNHRLRNLAEDTGVAVTRLRNHYLFGRVLARLAPQGSWFLKGGFALESRLGVAARATKDLDLLHAGLPRPSGLELQDLLDDALEADLGDGLSFRVGAPKAVRVEEAEPSTWRVTLVARVHGVEFGTASLDVVTTAAVDPREVDEISIPAVLGTDQVVMPAIDPERQAAEKLHAYARIYAFEQPSSRVKDLIDLTLLIERGLLDPVRLRWALSKVFDERDGVSPPAVLPAPPGNWREPYERLARETGMADGDVESAWRKVAQHYEQLMRSEESR